MKRTPLLLLALSLSLLSCKSGPSPKLPQKTASGAPFRLGWVTWSDVNELIYCNRRLDDGGEQTGVLGPCWQELAGERPKKLFSWLNGGRPDETPPNAGPWQRCAIELKGDSHGATATLLTPTGREPIEAWKPDASVAGDVYALELSFSPEGKWMAVLRLGVHLGDGERIVEVSSVDIRTVPACR